MLAKPVSPAHVETQQKDSRCLRMNRDMDGGIARIATIAQAVRTRIITFDPSVFDVVNGAKLKLGA